MAASIRRFLCQSKSGHVSSERKSQKRQGHDSVVQWADYALGLNSVKIISKFSGLKCGSTVVNGPSRQLERLIRLCGLGTLAQPLRRPYRSSTGIHRISLDN